MRRLFLLIPLALGLLLGACTQEPRPVRLDFIGSSRFTSSNRTASPGDTLSVRLYASGDSANNVDLQTFQVKVTYDPAPNPPVYATPAVPLTNQQAAPALLYLNQQLTAAQARQLVYQTTFGTRTTSGRETWEFTVSDGANSATRSFRVRVNNVDSLLAYHQYTLRIPSASARPPRPYVALLPGLAFPESTLQASLAGRQLIDLVYRPGTTALDLYQRPAGETGGVAQLRRAGSTNGQADSLAFLGFNTPARIAQAFTQAPPFAPDNTTGPLRLNQVVAFRTIDNHAGVFIVRRLTQTPYPVVELLVRVLKTPG